jgi:crotonobetainyl-CoA:carnitine CoA-transferase CaiB-like acyl-CoA transferase
MGDLGAEVIKLESPEGDIMRYAGPARHPAMGHVFLNLNRNKRSLCLDLKRPEAAEIFLALVRQSDVLMHNMRPRAMARLGFDYDRVRDINPRLVYCSARGYGQSGPLADRPAFDDIIQGASGFVALEQATGRRGALCADARRRQDRRPDHGLCGDGGPAAAPAHRPRPGS